MSLAHGLWHTVGQLFIFSHVEGCKMEKKKSNVMLLLTQCRGSTVVGAGIVPPEYMFSLLLSNLTSKAMSGMLAYAREHELLYCSWPMLSD